MVSINRHFFTTCIFTLSYIALLLITDPSHASYRDLGNPGSDQPDESFVLREELFPVDIGKTKSLIDPHSRIAILDNGFSREATMFTSLFIPVQLIEPSELLSDKSSFSFLIIPSGGLYVDDREQLEKGLDRFVREGGNLFVFVQRHGEEYSLLPLRPGEKITGYGWIESQSALSDSSMVSMIHPIVSGLRDSRVNVNVDGIIIEYPLRSKLILRDRISGQPVMLIWKYGKGNVIATTIFTDWAYIHRRATWDEVIMFSNMLRWAGLSLSPKAPDVKERVSRGFPSPEHPSSPGFSVHSEREVYETGESAGFTIYIWNYEDRERTIKVYYEGKGHKVHLSPYGVTHVRASTTLYSSRRLWIYFYDEKETFLKTIKKGYTVVFPESR